MGRHRRSAAGRAATGRATGVASAQGSYRGSHDPQDSYNVDYGPRSPSVQDPQHSYAQDPRDPYAGEGHPTGGAAPYLHTEAYTETSARSAAYLFATEEDYATFLGADAASSRGGGFPPDGGSPAGPAHRPRREASVPGQTGLLGVSA